MNWSFDQEEIAEYYNDLAFLYFSRGNYEKAYQYVEKALIQRNKIEQKVPDVEVKSYFLLGEIFLTQKHYRSALTYFLRALDVLYTTNLEPNRIYTYMHTQIAEIYRQLKDYDNALRHLTKAEQILDKLDKTEQHNLYEHIRVQKQIIQSLQKLNKVMSKLLSYIIFFAAGLAVITAGILIFYLFFKH
jgi:tetratricopeptide (TPR) repeat protein